MDKIIIAIGALGLGLALGITAMVPKTNANLDFVERCRREVARVDAFGQKERERFLRVRQESAAVDTNWRIVQWVAAFDEHAKRP